MNYRVVLADDEPEVLRSIQRTLDWEKYGFSVVGAFLNGLDVLEFLENHDVDIVFTDIRMPFMDGIELMHKIKEKYPYIKLVIISGYDDFQYAKEALIHGVLDYILKPINAREMSEVIQKVKDKMDTELEEKQSIQKLRKLYLENQPIIRENFLNRLVLGNIKAKALQEEKKTGLIRMGEYKYWATALVQIYQIEQKDHGETMDSQLASIYIRNLIRNSISDDIYYEAFYNPLGECILFGMNEPEEMERILLKLNDIAKESKRVMKIKAAIGVGKIKDELIKVKESFEEAKEALSYRKMSQDGDVIYMEDIDKSEQVILFRKFLPKQSMQNILYVIILTLTLLVAVFVGFFVSKSQQEKQAQIIVQDNQELAEQINVSMSQYLHSMMRLSDTLYYNIIKGNDRGQMEQMFQAMYDGYKDYVESIALFQEDGTLLQVMPALSSAASSDVMQEEWFSSALERSENIHFFRPQIQDCFEHNSSFPWVIPMSRFVQITHGNQVLSGVLLINIKYSALSEVFRNSTDDMNQYSFLMDSNGELIYHPRHALVNSGIIEKPPETLAEYQDGSYETEIGKQQVFCSVKTVGYTGWKIIRVIGKEELRSYGIKSTFFVLAVICQVVLFFQVVGSYISMVLTRPICNLEEDVKRISAGELDIKVHTAGSFEVYHLGRSIQKMTVRIKKLMREVIQEQEAKRKSELDSLQAQITPHFLYNTLDIVVWMIEENRKEDAAGMVTALARFLRISLSKGKNIITVADELEHARNYLMIQSLRAKDQFTYRIEKDPGTECFQVIKLIVQPIVENALYHGLEGMYGDGEIVIHAYTKDGDLYISVKDNGMGMSKEQAEALLDYTKELKTAKGNGIGVRNVHERIQLHFGKEYGVQIISEEDEGTEILLHLPAIMYGEKKE